MPRGRPTKAAKSQQSVPDVSTRNPPTDSHTRPAESTLSRRKLRTISVRHHTDHDAERLDSDLFRKTLSTPQTLRSVVIPTSRSSIGSSLSSLRGQSSESDDTPATSIAVTPAEPLPKTNVKRVLAVLNVQPPSARSKGKRKRMTGEDLEEADLLLARSLQEQEWDEEAGHRPAANKRRFKIENSEEGSELSSQDGPQDSGACCDRKLPLIAQRAESKQQGRPTRTPRSGAHVTSSLRGPLQVDDSDGDDETESSDVSAFTLSQNDSESDDADASEQEDVHVPEPPVRPMPNASDQTFSTQVVTRSWRREGRRQGRSRRHNRQSQSFQDRATRERRKLERAHPEILTMWNELEAMPRITPSQVSQPSTIGRKLKSFQLEGLDWMLKQEKSQWKGGLLGDEMGMGKTIQAVSLIMSDYPAKNPSLVVVPPVALMQWQNEIDQYTNGKLQVLIYHNTNPKVKGLTIKDLRSYDVIMISYSGLESIYRKESKGWKRDEGLIKENSKIHALHYHRIILDEAHSIKTRTTSVAKACFALKADYKWCLSGTPVQNRIGEFFSLLRFLQITPFASYFCKKCPCARLHWDQDASKRCTHCQHTGLEHVSIFNQELLNPITQQGDLELRREGLRKLRLVTDRIMLRRLKRDHTASMELPPKEVIIHNEFFGEIERDFSTSIMSNTHRQFDTYVSRGVMLNNYANIFGLIMQMRQVANHPDLILRKHAEGDQNVLVCCICDEMAEEPIRSRCHHEFCRKCAKDYVKTFETEMPDCPRCHIPLSIDFEQPDIEQDEDKVKKNSIINRIKMEEWTSSTKIEMLVYDLYKLRNRKQTHKSIVFSQFTSMLQLVEWRLRRAGFNTVMLDGSMSPAQRQRSIDYFMNNVDVEVFLVSLKAGGVALNLTEASRVFIVDPWWNPAAEWQSADRCHRIGQKRPCVITRLCIEDSVESRIVMLQEKKANMINGTINNDQVAIEKLTPEDMQFLFRGS